MNFTLLGKTNQNPIPPNKQIFELEKEDLLCNLQKVTDRIIQQQ